MKLGALVVRKNMWGIESNSIGLVIERLQCVENRGDIWNVLWASKGKNVIKEHYGDALVDLSEGVLQEAREEVNNDTSR